jgi:hypothetical protein
MGRQDKRRSRPHIDSIFRDSSVCLYPGFQIAHVDVAEFTQHGLHVAGINRDTHFDATSEHESPCLVSSILWLNPTDTYRS